MLKQKELQEIESELLQSHNERSGYKVSVFIAEKLLEEVKRLNICLLEEEKVK